MAKVAISLDDEAVRELALLAREARTSKEALVRQAIERLVLQSHHAPAIPRYARRLGPLVIRGNDR
jgi:predicted transcriptional regulator